MIKVYKMNGKTEAHEVFTSPSGKTVYKVAFKKGNLDPKNRVPAKFSTSDPVIQNVIESSPKFGKTIFLDRVFGEPAAPAPVAVPEVPAPAPAPAAKKKAAPKAAALKEMPEVKTIADAATVLLAEGAPASDIDGTVEGAIKAAKSLGLSFPNLKEE